MGRIGYGLIGDLDGRVMLGMLALPVGKKYRDGYGL